MSGSPWGVRWTEQRRDRALELAALGLSASQVANDLGGVTRNAVIGVLHRMRKRNPSITTRLHNINFQNRPNGQKPRSTLPRGKDGSITNSINTKIRRSRSEARTDQAIKFRLNTKCGQEQAQFASEAADKLIPVEQRKQLLDLENCHCRWGVGDPTKEEFFFCGAPDADLRASIPYCLEHAARAGVGFGKIDPSILRSQ